MARRRKIYDIPGQIEFCFDTEKYVVQGNGLINGRQSVGLSAARILRAVIMQVKPDDTELKTYNIPVGQLAHMIQANRSTLTHDIDKITDEILQNPIVVKEYDVSKKEYRFAKIPWLEFVAYTSKSGLSIKLNDQLRDYVLQLSKQYTQYILQDVLQMKSVYGIRLYEILLSRVYDRVLPKDGVKIEISVEDLRRATGTESKFERYSNFRQKVIERAEAEIMRTTAYKVTHEEKRTGRKVVSIIFHLTMSYY